MVYSHCCQHTVSFLTVYLCFLFYFSWVFWVEYGGGQLGTAYLWCWTLVPSVQPLLWVIWVGGRLGTVYLWCQTSVPSAQPLPVGYLRGGAYLAMHVCAAGLQCHTRNLFLCGLICGLFGGANLAVHVCATGLRCHTRNLLCGLFEGGAYLAMCVCAAVLWCHTRNLLCCGLFEGANLAVHVCAAILQCHTHNLLLSGLFHFTFSYILHDSVHSYSF